ncbi:hypothetical protein JCM18909_4056 [Cutibacterium acnes JCM 18909]|nr:hypothetical protein JCM18909_4056 [Cutibacterium acnes JCM 18909]
MRVEGVVTSLNADVDNVIDSRIRFQISLDDILVLDCRRISGDNDPQSHGSSMSRCRVLKRPTRNCEQQRLMTFILTAVM